MTRRSVYIAALAVFLAASALTLTSIILPRWISWDARTASGARIHHTYGLHQSCSSLSPGCRHFPRAADCHGGDRAFCSLWRSVGFLMNFAVVLEGMTLISFVVVIAGGRQRRAQGWAVLSGLAALVAALQCAGFALIAYLYDHDDRFFPGWKLDASWILCTVSGGLMLLVAAGVGASPFLLADEGGYELIPVEGG